WSDHGMGRGCRGLCLPQFRVPWSASGDVVLQQTLLEERQLRYRPQTGDVHAAWGLTGVVVRFSPYRHRQATAVLSSGVCSRCLVAFSDQVRLFRLLPIT
ncbi:MAG: hypothetical protein MK358_13515, partial [Vicinamibacterales bacterium]|nr:hypothetical protein [Vicinamibacterales bacterium]